MKSISTALANHIAGTTTTLATLWRITRRDGEVFTFTDHDRDIVYGGETYLAALGYQRAAISGNADLAVDDSELTGMLNSGLIEPAHLRAGLWDHAELRILAVNWADLSQGEIKLRRGRLGEVVAMDDGSFRAEFRGMAQPLQATIGSLYQPECRADLGDARCRIDLAYGAGWTQQATVETVASSVLLVMSADIAGFADTYFTFGVATWQTGDNAGVSREIIAWTQGSRTLELFAPPPFAPAAGDTLHIQPGCDKLRPTCQGTFDNYANFRGEPFVPGQLAVLGRGGA